MILNDFTEPKLKFGRDKLDALLTDLCELLIKKQQENPDFYGMVAAAVIDTKGRVATGVNYLYGNERIHAERAAIDKYEEEYGELPKGSIVVTTLSPCSQDTHDNRQGCCCSELLNHKGVKLAYCGYKDPTQENKQDNFVTIITSNSKIEELCKRFADTFLKKELNETKDDTYHEIEFVCVNRNSELATNKQAQIKLYKLLKAIPGVIPLWQDWSHIEPGQKSLTAIYKEQSTRNAIINAAKLAGVRIDLEQEVSDDYVDRAMRGEHEGQVNEVAEPSRAKQFIDNVYSQYPDWPYGQADKVMVWGEGEDQQFAAFKLKPGAAPDTVEIDWIMAGPEQRQGVGSRAIKELQRQAQEAGIKLTLYPWAKGNVSQASLTKLYKRHGFKPVAKGAKPMRWEPQLDELKIDNVNGLGSVPWNQEVDYMGLRVMMKPSTFLQLSLPLKINDDDKKTIQHLEKEKDTKGFGAPFLQVDMDQQFPRITGHDGRHRMIAIQQTEGDHPVEVHIFPKGMRNKDMTPELIDKLNDLVISQSGKYVVGPLFTYKQ